MRVPLQQPKKHVGGVVLSLLVLVFAVVLGTAVRDTRVQKAMKELPVEEWFAAMTERSEAVYDHAPDRPGRLLSAQGVTAHYPLILIPGFVTSGLELWGGHECAEGLFRTRLWTHMHMAKAFFNDRLCWMSHLSLNFTTGLDPRGIRVRPAQGIDAIDFFFPGYDVWAKVIMALADIGYDSTTMVALPYDWRLSIPNMERRDAYFTKLRYQVEVFRQVYDKKVMLAAHSWGDNVARAFLHWMEDTSPGWVAKHIAVHFNIAGPTLGVPKAATSLLSGELKETSQLAGLAYLLGEQLLGKEDRTLVWRTWGSALGMLPIGGRAVWGNATWAPDDEAHVVSQGRSFGGEGESSAVGQIDAPDAVKLSLMAMSMHVDPSTPRHDQSNGADQSMAPMLTVVDVPKGAGNATAKDWAMKWLTDSGTDALNSSEVRPLDVVAVVTEILRDAGPVYQHHLESWSNAELADDVTSVVDDMTGKAAHRRYPANESVSGTRSAIDAILRAIGLPDGPTLNKGLPTKNKDSSLKTYNPLTTPLPKAPDLKLYCGYGYGIATERAYHYSHTEPQPDAQNVGTTITQSLLAEGQWHINTRAHAPEAKLLNGVEFSDGDGTVPLISLGAMCAGGWQTKRLNPAGIQVVTREYRNKEKNIFKRGGDLRGGPEASAHVEVLGNKHFLTDFLYVAAGWHDKVQDDIGSNITAIVSQMSGT